MRTALLVVLLGFSLLAARAEDWITTDGKTYRNVTVLSHDDAYVVIMHDDGGGRILLSQLNPILQKRFGYDPAKAAACIQATATADQQEHAALVQEETRQDAALARQTAAAAAPGAPPLSPPAPAAAPGRPPAAAGTPSVNVVANEVKIEDDQRQLDDLAVDIRTARRDVSQNYYYWQGGAHYDNTGTLHPNAVGSSAADRLPEMLQRQTDLQTEIKKLQDQDTQAQTASTR